MAAQLPEISAIAVAIESTKGTANAPITPDAGIEVENLSYEVAVEHGERNPQGAAFDRPVSVPMQRMVDFSFRCPIAGHTAAGLAPMYAKILRGCGLAEALVASTSATYSPISRLASQETCTVDLFTDGKRIRVLGAMFNAIFNVPFGEIAHIEFTGRGVFDDETDNDLPASIPYVEVAPPAAIGATLTWKSYSVIGTGFTLDLGNDVQLRPSMAAATGYLHAFIANREPSATLEVEDELIASLDILAQMESSGVAELLCQWGSVAGNIHRLLASAAQLVGAPYGERNGLKTRNLAFRPRRNTIAGDNFANYRVT